MEIRGSFKIGRTGVFGDDANRNDSGFIFFILVLSGDKEKIAMKYSAAEYCRTKGQRYSLRAELCEICGNTIFPPRDVCPYCVEIRKANNGRINFGEKGGNEVKSVNEVVNV